MLMLKYIFSTCLNLFGFFLGFFLNYNSKICLDLGYFDKGLHSRCKR